MKFDIHETICDEYGEVDFDALPDYIDGLMSEFAESPEGEKFIEEHDGIGWAASMIEYGVNYNRVTPADMSLYDFEEIVFELFPRKVSAEAVQAAEIIAELTAFWTFINRQYNLTNAKKIADSLSGKSADRLQKRLADPANWGMAKSFFMKGKEAGFDMATEKGLQAFMLQYNSKILNLTESNRPVGVSDAPTLFIHGGSEIHQSNAEGKKEKSESPARSNEEKTQIIDFRKKNEPCTQRELRPQPN